jgi:hypothetical protein
VEVVGQERNGAVCERVAAGESSCVGAELVTALKTNCVISSGEKIVTLDIYVSATLETDVLGAGEDVH